MLYVICNIICHIMLSVDMTTKEGPVDVISVHAITERCDGDETGLDNRVEDLPGTCFLCTNLNVNKSRDSKPMMSRSLLHPDVISMITLTLAGIIVLLLTTW